MAVIPMRWQGASRIEALRARILERAERWAEDWSAVGVPLRVEVEALHAQRPEIATADIRWYGMRRGGASLSLRVAGQGLERLGCALVDVDDADAAGLAAGVGRRAMTDLARAFFGADAPAEWAAIAGVPPASEIGPRHGAFGVQLSIDSLRFELHFDAGLCDALLPIAAARGETLVPRRDALPPIEARFEAELDLGPLPLAESLSLKPGDVLKTSARLDAGIRLKAADGGGILTGTLTADGDHRALKIVKTPLQGNKTP